MTTATLTDEPIYVLLDLARRAAHNDQPDDEEIAEALTQAELDRVFFDKTVAALKQHQATRQWVAQHPAKVARRDELRKVVETFRREFTTRALEHNDEYQNAIYELQNLTGPGNEIARMQVARARLVGTCPHPGLRMELYDLQLETDALIRAKRDEDDRLASVQASLESGRRFSPEDIQALKATSAATHKRLTRVLEKLDAKRLAAEAVEQKMRDF